jgi:hypothetical protein
MLGLSLEQAFAVVVGLATFAGIALAVYYGRREGRNRKVLAYQASTSFGPIASSAELSEYNLSLAYEQEGEEPRRIDDAYAHFLRFANLGHEPIRREDIAPANPLRVEVAGGVEVLDASLEAVAREVARIDVGQIEAGEDLTTLAITFDFLDYQDGAVIRLMTTSRPDEVALVGDIIGMPEGVREASEITTRRKFWGPLGVVLVVLFEASAFAAVALAYRLAIGDWTSLWLLPLPILALVGPLIIALIVSETIWPTARPIFPRPLRRGGPFVIGDERVLVMMEQHQAALVRREAQQQVSAARSGQAEDEG